jgi:hypothetical protein
MNTHRPAPPVVLGRPSDATALVDFVPVGADRARTAPPTAGVSLASEALPTEGNDSSRRVWLSVLVFVVLLSGLILLARLFGG